MNFVCLNHYVKSFLEMAISYFECNCAPNKQQHFCNRYFYAQLYIPCLFKVIMSVYFFVYHLSFACIDVIVLVKKCIQCSTNQNQIQRTRLFYIIFHLAVLAKFERGKFIKYILSFGRFSNNMNLTLKHEACLKRFYF